HHSGRHQSVRSDHGEIPDHHQQWRRYPLARVFRHGNPVAAKVATISKKQDQGAPLKLRLGGVLIRYLARIYYQHSPTVPQVHARPLGVNLGPLRQTTRQKSTAEAVPSFQSLLLRMSVVKEVATPEPHPETLLVGSGPLLLLQVSSLDCSTETFPLLPSPSCKQRASCQRSDDLLLAHTAPSDNFVGPCTRPRFFGRAILTGKPQSRTDPAEAGSLKARRNSCWSTKQ